MDIDAEFIRLRTFIARAEPVLAEYEASRGDGMGTPSGFTTEQWTELSRIEDRLGMFENRITPWEQGENSVPPIIQELAQCLIQRADAMEAKLAEVDKFSGELARLSRLTADLAEIIENDRTATGVTGEVPDDGGKAPPSAE